ETLAVSRFLLAGAAAEGLRRRAIDPALPAVLAERLTRTALAALRIQERLLRLLAQASEEDAMRAAPLPGVWAQWREDLLRREAYERAAAEARVADREATVAAEAARVAADAGAAQPGDVTASTETQPCRRDSLQSGKPEPVPSPGRTPSGSARGTRLCNAAGSIVGCRHQCPDRGTRPHAT